MTQRKNSQFSNGNAERVKQETESPARSWWLTPVILGRLRYGESQFDASQGK
jgi:hypothetical protein